MFRLYRKNNKISAVTWANSIVSQEQYNIYLISTPNKVLIRVSIRKTFAQFLIKKANFFAFVKQHFCAKK